jgi:hypothetical protein
MQSGSGGQFSPIPRAMIEMLAKMKLEEDMEEARLGSMLQTLQRQKLTRLLPTLTSKLSPLAKGNF